MTDYNKYLANVEENNRRLAKALPRELAGFMNMHNAALEEGALSPKTKELIALGISICIKCEPCITAHMKSLLQMGVNKKEIDETVGVALFMGGGPATAYGGKVLEAYEQMVERFQSVEVNESDVRG